MMARKSVCLRMVAVLFWLTVISVPAGAQMWTQTDWSGGPGQLSWSDSTMYYTGVNVNPWLNPGDLALSRDLSTWVNTGELAGATDVWSLIEASDGALYAGTDINGDVFRSIDGGITWVNTGDLAGATDAMSLIQASDGALYAGTNGAGDVFKSIDAGTTWVNTGELAGAGFVSSLLEASDGALYAGTYSNGDVFKSIDAGTTWANTGELTGAIREYSLIETSDGALYAGTGATDGDVFRSIDAGTTWTNTGDLVGAMDVWSLIEASGGALYAGTGPNGDVFKSVDAGTTWVNTGELGGATHVMSLIETSDGVLYAGTGNNGDVFESVNAGTAWANTGDLVGAAQVWSLIEASDGALYAGTNNNGDVFKARGYFLAGELVSSVYETENANVNYGTMTWVETLNGQTIYMRVRTDTLPDMSTALDWSSCPPVVNGQDISDLSSVDDFEQYVQYRVVLATTRSDVTPVLHEVSIEYELVGVEEGFTRDLPLTAHRLLQNQPNPFSGGTNISYSLPSAVHVMLDVYDLSGRLVETIVNETQQSGIHQTSWNGNGRAAGLYFYRLRAGDFEYTRKMVIID